MVHLFKRVYISTVEIAGIIPMRCKTLPLLKNCNFWSDVYDMDKRVLVIANVDDFSATLVKLYNTIFPGIADSDMIELLLLVDSQFNNMIGISDRDNVTESAASLANFKTNKTLSKDTLGMPLRLEDISIEYLLMAYVNQLPVNHVILPRLDLMFRKKVCGVMYDFKTLFIDNLPSIAKQYNVDIFSSDLKQQLISKNHNFKYIFDSEWTPNTLTGLNRMLKLEKLEVLDFYKFIFDSFIRYRTDQWPMISGVQDFYNHPDVILDAMVAGTDYRTRGWPGDEWFYQINKMIWAKTITDPVWAKKYATLLSL